MREVWHSTPTADRPCPLPREPPFDPRISATHCRDTTSGSSQPASAMTGGTAATGVSGPDRILERPGVASTARGNGRRRFLKSAGRQFCGSAPYQKFVSRPTRFHPPDFTNRFPGAVGPAWWRSGPDRPFEVDRTGFSSVHIANWMCLDRPVRSADRAGGGLGHEFCGSPSLLEIRDPTQPGIST